jgi:pilus assembly protein FimV
VGRAITVAMFAAALTLVAPAAALAAGLGRINVLSPLGQPLDAEIEIVALRPGEEETLVARIAPLEAFTAAGIEPSAVLNTMRFAVERRDNRRILRVTTTAPVNDPFVELLVELQWQSGRLVREYTFLLDPPEYKSRDAATAQRAPAAKPAPAPDVKAPPPVIAAAPTPPPAAAEPQAEKPAAEPAKPEPAKEEAKPETKPEPPAAAELVKEPPKEQGGKPAEPKV